jgi:prepilin-type N-terminal cleavage/methylation domain-containing protein
MLKTSHPGYFKQPTPCHNVFTQKGFSLVELLVVIAIIGLIMTLITANYGTYRTNAQLNNATNEVALALREVQVFGLSFRAIESEPQRYGIYVTSSAEQSDLFNGPQNTGLVIYADNAGNGVFQYQSNTEEALTIYRLTQGFHVSRICADACRDHLDVTFTRPNPDASIVLRPHVNANPQGGGHNFGHAVITVSAPGGERCRMVSVWATGQISVGSITTTGCAGD